MHYLKCDKCGFYNEVTSEYLTFCKSCNEKITTNFASWKKAHPERNFQDFKNDVCVSEEEKSSLEKPTKKKNKSPKYWIGFAIVFLIFTLIGSIGGKHLGSFISNLINNTQIETTLLQKEWVKKTYPLGLSLETPIALERTTLPIPENVKAYIEKMNCYTIEKDLFGIAVNTFQYKPIVGQVSLEGAAQGSVNEMKSQKGVSGFTYNQEQIEKNGISGILQKGTFLQNKKAKIAFVNIALGEKLALWQVIVTYKAGDEVGKKMAERIIKSIEIK